ncbi:MAG: biopolymer transporter ExbD [Kofleriaceae bacterium]
MAGAGAHSSNKHRRRWRLSGRKLEIDHVRNDINVTPLVDVMLVLLIIFMLMVMTMGRGYEVTLAKSRKYSSEKDVSQPVVSIDIEGELFFEKTKIGPVTPDNLKDMQAKLEAAWKAPKNPLAVNRIYLKADTRLEYAKVYPILFHLNRVMNIDSVDLAVSEFK